ncbi:MAG: ABC transporter permease [Desulfobulbaceae bacterium]|nr:ABC transporter permease [Desulfobulbaceae bacterium]
MLNELKNFLRLIYQHKHLILSMAKREVARRYVGSFLGIVWTLIHPMMMIFVFWFVFSRGFRVQPVGDVPFVVWLTAGMAPWFLFADIINGSSMIIIEHANLIKKTLFPVQILPFIKLVSCSITHSIFLFLLLFLISSQHMSFSYYFIQFSYYFLALLIFSLGISWAISSLNVFVRDVGQMTAVIIQLGFWATPIFWNIDTMPPKIQLILKINPIFYIINGYRESFIYFIPFWDHPKHTAYFWTVTLFTFLGGAFIFKKLKPQFADAL